MFAGPPNPGHLLPPMVDRDFDSEKVKVTVMKSGDGKARSKHEVLAYDRSIWQSKLVSHAMSTACSRRKCARRRRCKLAYDRYLCLLIHQQYLQSANSKAL